MMPPSFEKARIHVRNLGMRSIAQYRRWSKSEFNSLGIPSNPEKVYANTGWLSWSDFLAATNLAEQRSQYWSFEDARKYVRRLGLKSRGEWNAWVKTADRFQALPLTPQRVYAKHGWSTWGDFLGSERVANQNRRFRTFTEARMFACCLNLRGQSEWASWAKTAERPKDIPAAPYRTYRAEWKGWGDFLGTGNTSKRDFLSFEEAKAYAQSLSFKGVGEWEAWAKTDRRPKNIPSAPSKVYKNRGWTNWGDFLGTGRIANQKIEFFSYMKAHNFAKKLHFSGKSDWGVWAKTEKRPSYIPAAPDVVYKDKGWETWGKFLGTGAIGPKDYRFRSFEEARKYVRNLGIKNSLLWRVWAKDSNERPKDIPSLPSRTYAGKGWSSWGDFLGTGRIANQNIKYKNYESAKKFVRSMGFSSIQAYRYWAKENGKLYGLPINPAKVYEKKGWNGWIDFLGNQAIVLPQKHFRSFEEAREFVRSLGLQSSSQWRIWAKSDSKPVDIPSYPNEAYAKQGWISWPNFLGTEKKPYLSFGEARKYAWGLRVRRSKDWSTLEHPENIPRYPNIVYKKKGWLGWKNFLGEGNANPQESFGADKIADYLKRNKIEFKKEQSFSTLVSKKGRQLRYDFYLPKYRVLIEFHGLQHFEARGNHWGGVEQLSITQFHDKLKEEYAKNNRYRLFIISYKDEKRIDKKMDEILAKLL